MSQFGSTTDKKFYHLKKKDESLVKFSIAYDILGEAICDDVEILATNIKLLPQRLINNVTSQSILEWIEGRFVPKNRRFVDELVGTVLRENDNRLAKLLEVTLCLSLIDDYWVVPVKRDSAWRHHSLFRNDFSETLALVAFTGYNQKIRGLASSPELTTDGALRKCWRRIDGKVYLYKGGTEGYANAGLEPYSEMYASQVAKAMGIDHVSYHLEKWKGVLCSVCKLFTSEEYSLVNAYDIFFNERIINVLPKLDVELRESLLDMLAFDAIIVNSDRHFANFGFLRDETGRLVKVAPIFDNGVSLLNYAMADDLDDIDVYLATKDMTFAKVGANRLDVIANLLGPRQKKMVRKLLGFEFEKQGEYNLPKDRLDFLSKMVRYRASLLLQY